MVSEVINITPQMAEEMLTHNIVNRKLAVKRVHAYATDMKNGMWEQNGESIRFNEAGELIDGQHRLSAIIEANIPVPIYVTRGISSSITLYDRGKPRNEADSLLIGGMPKELANNNIIAVVKLHYVIQFNSFNTPPFSYVKDFLNTFSEPLITLYNMTTNKHHNNKLNIRTAPLLLPCFYALALFPEREEKIRRFLEVITSGFYETREHESAAIVLRNDIIQGHFGSKCNQDRFKSEFMAEKALYDFLNRVDRRITYKNAGSKIYSNNPLFKIDKIKYK